MCTPRSRLPCTWPSEPQSPDALPPVLGAISLPPGIIIMTALHSPAATLAAKADRPAGLHRPTSAGPAHRCREPASQEEEEKVRAKRTLQEAHQLRRVQQLPEPQNRPPDQQAAEV
ncbi:hypothetical protein scyTo_0026172 [Scyliorhinus torazame]|uniref:Uncharacterized protein n=1 Tax=Scyliorhinus torazame TaxID=75743 RepID=A0A401QJA3_SCYTO|nr:hypothetical protein [Scyliorhinus torazame]